jgi:hypothetical protein
LGWSSPFTRELSGERWRVRQRLGGGVAVHDDGLIERGGRLRQRVVGSLPSVWTVELERVGGWVVVPRTVELARVVGRGGRLPETLIDNYAFASSLLSSPLLSSFYRSSSPRLCVAVGIPGGGWGPGFPTGVERSEAVGWWSGAFHTRSASTAWVGGCFACVGSSVGSPRAASRSACRPAKPRLDLRADLRAALRGQSFGPHPPLSPSDQFPRGWRI